jgi:hypothetical protein
LTSETEKKLRVKAMATLDADVVALQKVENLDVLKRFLREWLKNGIFQ